MRLLMLLLLMSPTWMTGEWFFPVRNGDLDEIRELLQTLVPDVTYETVRHPPGLRCRGEVGALEQVAELLAELDRPTHRVELEVLLVDTRGWMGTPRPFAVTSAHSLPPEFPELYRWDIETVDSDREARFTLSWFRLWLKPSVKADGYVVFELDSSSADLAPTSIRVKEGHVILFGGLFHKADTVQLEDILRPGFRPIDLAVAIRWRIVIREEGAVGSARRGRRRPRRSLPQRGAGGSGDLPYRRAG